MTWQPIYQKDCTFCAPRIAQGEQPYCVSCCPTKALALGNDEDAESPFNVELERCKKNHYHIFDLPAYENARANIVYATRE